MSLASECGPRDLRKVGGHERPLRLLGGLLLLVLVSGCAATSPRRYVEFATAGQTYVETFDALAERSVRSAVRVDSRLLEQQRSRMERDRRVELLDEHNVLLRERIELVRDLRRHAQMLSDYFTALAALAEDDAPVVAADAAQTLADSIGSLSHRLEAKPDVSEGIAKLAGSLTQVVVGQVRRSALRSELRARAGTIARELLLQEAAVAALGDQLRHERELEASWRETDEVARPYAADTALPPDWRERRWDVLSTSLNQNEIEAAASAVRRVRQAFQGLVAGKFGRDDARALVDELQLARRRLKVAEGTAK